MPTEDRSNDPFMRGRGGKDYRYHISNEGRYKNKQEQNIS